MKAPWTEAHQREALRRLYEIAATIAGGAAYPLADPAAIVGGMANHHATEDAWRSHLAWLFGFNGGFKWRRRVDREVARVRGLAEARLVRETSVVLRAYGRFGGVVAEYALEKVPSVVPGDLRRVRVTRIRRAP